MSNSAKNYAKSVLEGYAGTLERLKERYSTAIAAINKEHDLKNKQIALDSNKKKNSADAANKVSLHNTKASLLDKGLSASGESVQAELDHNLARNNAFSEIEGNASREREANEMARASAKASAFTDYLDSVGKAESEKNAAYIKQLNADRDYEAARDDEKHDRYVDTRNYEAARDDERYDRFADNRDYEAEREDEKHDRYVDTRNFEAEREDEYYDRFADNRDYEAERDDESYDRLSKESEVTGGGASSEKDTDDRIDPKMSPKDFVDAIKLTHTSKYYESKEKRQEAIRLALKAIIDDPTLTYSYRHQVKIYAEAMGLY